MRQVVVCASHSARILAPLLLSLSPRHTELLSDGQLPPDLGFHVLQLLVRQV